MDAVQCCADLPFNLGLNMSKQSFTPAKNTAKIIWSCRQGKLTNTKTIENSLLLEINGTLFEIIYVYIVYNMQCN